MTQRWQDVRPRVVTDEQRVADARQQLDAEVERARKQPEPDLRSWSMPPSTEWALGQLQADAAQLPMPRPEYQHEPMMDADDTRTALGRLRPEDMDVAKRQLRDEAASP